MRAILNGWEVTVADGEYDSFWERASCGDWEPDTFRAFDRYVTPGTSVIDIGAWIGPTSLYAAHTARRVVAFEPDPRAFEELQRNVALNPRLPIDLAHAAVTVEAGSVRLQTHKRPGDSQSSIVDGQSGKSVKVDAVRLDDFLLESNVEPPLFVKVDVEGYEYELLPSVVSVIKEHGGVLHLSTHPWILKRKSKRGRMLRHIEVFAANLRLLCTLGGFSLYDSAGRTPISRPALAIHALLRGKVTNDASLVAVWEGSH